MKKILMVAIMTLVTLFSYPALCDGDAEGEIVCFASNGETLQSKISARFGRCEYLVFVDLQTMDVNTMANPNRDVFRNAGMKTASLVIESDADIVVTNYMGYNSINLLENEDIIVMSGKTGKIEDVIDKYFSE